MASGVDLSQQTEFFYCTDGQTVEGPVHSVQLFEMYKNGRLPTDAQICTCDEGWMALMDAIKCRKDLPEFTAHVIQKAAAHVVWLIVLGALCVLGMMIGLALLS